MAVVRRTGASEGRVEGELLSGRGDPRWWKDASAKVVAICEQTEVPRRVNMRGRHKGAQAGEEPVCDSGHCAPGCFDDAGCPAGQACEANKCVPGDESPYNDCVTSNDCAGDSLCINKSAGYQGSFCSPLCINKQCPAPAPGVESLGAQCAIYVGINLEPTHCAVICDLAGGACGPMTTCEDKLLPPQMGINPGICTHPI